MRFDLGASESWQMTGILAATRSSSGVIESGLTGDTARPVKSRTIASSSRLCCSASSPLRGRITSALMPRSCSAFSTPFLAMFQNPAELLVTKAKWYFLPPAGAEPPPPSPDFLQLANPIMVIAANAATTPLRTVIVIFGPYIPARKLFYHFRDERNHFREEASAAFQASSTRMLPS